MWEGGTLTALLISKLVDADHPGSRFIISTREPEQRNMSRQFVAY